MILGKNPDQFDDLMKLPGVGRRRQSDYGRCVSNQAIVTDPQAVLACKPHRTGRSDKRTKESRDGALENCSAGRRK